MSKINNIIKPPRTILKSTAEALMEFKMINDGDRILLGLSGGKDSLSLLHCLLYFQSTAPIKFSIKAATIDPMIDDFNPMPLVTYLKKLNISYQIHREPMEKLAQQHMKKNSFCSFCSRMRRGLLYKIARSTGCNILALGQHSDDIAESFFMSLFFNGNLKTMKANYTNKDGDIRIIRPLIYVRERQIIDYAKSANLPIINDNCPACFAQPMQREKMKFLLSQQEKTNPTLFKSLKKALKPLIKINNAV
ncbi:MAG: tRNA 2-thiocytidine biosynthesis protein TtcA [Gammaproteobacteria bacterium]|nr:MAG: tRNA 2-thiocytidine biosynthesis protein TtcA [Gammaproteobacteria bacterium]